MEVFERIMQGSAGLDSRHSRGSELCIDSSDQEYAIGQDVKTQNAQLDPAAAAAAIAVGAAVTPEKQQRQCELGALRCARRCAHLDR